MLTFSAYIRLYIFYLQEENFDTIDFDLDVEDIVEERVDVATDSNADAVVNGDGDVTNLIQSKSEYKSREKVTCQFCQKVIFSILFYIN